MHSRHPGNNNIDETNPKDLIGCKKPPISFVPPSAIIYMAIAFKNGAEKYGAYNWREKKVKMSIYIDATMRHLLALLDGEDEAQDSKLSHLAHAMASLAVLVDAKETGNLVDDRPKKGPASRLIQEFNDKQKECEFSFTAENITELKDAGFSDESIESLRRGLDDVNKGRVSDYKPGCFDDEEHEYCLQNRYSQEHPNLNHSDDCADSNESQ